MDAMLLHRLRLYLAERFPLAAYLPLMAIAAFAAVAFSRAARIPEPAADATAAFPWAAWAVGTFTLVVFFFFLRALDEHKDARHDARHRPELPVPRGLITLRELRGTALAALGAAILFNATLDPRVLVPMAVAMAWAGFMGREFFVGSWLRARPALYLLSHMVVMPLVFFYATSLDWLVAGASPPPGTGVFLALCFFNGLVIEVGRKLRSPGEEREGVDTYTAAWGRGPATAVWLTCLMAAAVLVLGLLLMEGDGAAAVGVGPAPVAVLAALGALAVLLLGATVPAVLLLARPDRPRARAIEAVAGAWVLGSYALVGLVAWLRLGTLAGGGS